MREGVAGQGEDREEPSALINTHSKNPDGYFVVVLFRMIECVSLILMMMDDAVGSSDRYLC